MSASASPSTSGAVSEQAVPGPRIRVEVAYAEPRQQALVALEVPVGTTLAEAIDQSGLRVRFPQLEVHPERVGIFGRKAALTDVLSAGDRVEIYRPLLIDPKAARRARAAQAAKS